MVLVISTLAIIYNDLLKLAVLLILAIIIAIALKSDLISILKRIKKLILLMLAIAFIQSITSKTGNTVFSMGDFILITDHGLIRA